MELIEEIQKPANIDSLPFLLDFVASRAEMLGFKDEKKTNVCLAIEEALNNIIFHGEPDENKEINIAFKLDNLGRLLIVITDSGAPFNMLLSDVIPEEKSVKDSRPAISTKIMKKVIKDIEYKRIEGKNCLTFTIVKTFNS